MAAKIFGKRYERIYGKLRAYNSKEDLSTWKPSGQQPPRKVLKLDPRDNVIVALFPLQARETVSCDGHHYTLVENAPAKHKFAAIDFEPGDDIIMYGVLVAKASQKISRGQLLSTNNLRHDASPYQRRNQSVEWTAPDVSRWRLALFRLSPRRRASWDPQLWIVLHCFCENRNLAVLKRRALRKSSASRGRRAINNLFAS